MKHRCTILLPVYNGLPYLEYAITSLLAQTEKSSLIYVLDDGSTDGTSDYLKTINKNEVKIFTLEKGGLTKALNYGLERVTTEYVARMDADDISDKCRIEKQIKYLESNPECVLVGGWIRYISEDGNRRSWEIRAPLNHDGIVSKLKLRQSAIVNATTMCRTEAVIKAGWHDSTTFPAEDYDLFIRMSQIGKLANLPQVILDVRIHEKSVISNNFFDSLTKYAESVEKHFGKKIKRSRRMYLYFDACSAIVYRKGLHYYLNRIRIFGVGLIIIAIILNPLRLGYFLSKRVLKR